MGARRARALITLFAIAAILMAETPGISKPAGHSKGKADTADAAVAAPGSAPDVAKLLGDSDADDDKGNDKSKKAPQIDLSKGPFIEQLEKGQMPVRAYTPAPESIKPYVSASLGPELAFTLVHDGEPLVVAPRLEAECQGIVNVLLAHWKGPPTSVRVHISANRAYGARANSAGMIVVFLGTFVGDGGEYKIANRDELALLLGHELAHVLLLHPRPTGAMELLTKAFQYGSGFYSGYSIFKDTSYSNNQINMKPDTDMLIRSIGADAASSSVMLDLLLPGRTRHREMEADELGLDLAWRSGYRVTAQDVSNFVQHNTEDNARTSERMNAMRGVMITMLTRALAKHAPTGGGTFGPLSGLMGMAGMKAANIAATRLFDALAKARKEHLDPYIRADLLGKYYEADVKGRPDFDVKTEPRPAKLPRTVLTWHAQISPTANSEARSLYQAMAWLARYDDFALDAMGSAMEDDEDRIKEEEKHSGIIGKLREAMVKTAEANTEESGKPGVSAAPAAPPVSQKNQELLKRAQDLAGGMSRPGNVNPLMASSSHGAGRLSSLLLHQEPRGQGYWSDGERRGYPIAKLYRAYGASLKRVKAENRLPALVEDYRAKIGTTDPVLDIAVGAEVAKGNTVAAETLAAHCLELSADGLYPSCAAFLGYNPAAKGGKAKTPEGEKAFAGAKISAGIKGFLNLGGSDNP